MAKCRTKQTSEQLYKQVDGVWTEAEVKAKKVRSDQIFDLFPLYVVYVAHLFGTSFCR